MCSCDVPGTVIDVRQLMPHTRHATIFAAFDELTPGASLVLVSDHDPKPLHYQFGVQRAGAFGWEYLEQGPAAWRVRISRST